MHDSALSSLIDWYDRNAVPLAHVPLAEVGSRIINGSVRQGLRGRKVTGFDVVPGPGVDVVIEPGEIPPEHQNAYAAVISVSSFQFCPDSELYKKELVDLVKPQGLLFLTMCLPTCTITHSTSPNQWDWTDHIRMKPDELEALLAPDFKAQQIRLTSHDIVFEGKATNTAV